MDDHPPSDQPRCLVLNGSESGVTTEVLRAPRIGGRFKDNLDEAVTAAGLTPIDWSRGVWQSIARLHARRVDYVHRTAAGADLFPAVDAANEALDTIRSALASLHAAMDLAGPTWLADDSDRGWMGGVVARDYAYGTSIHAGVDIEAQDTLRISFKDAQGEHEHAFHPATADPEELARTLLRNLHGPVSAIRVYRGRELVLEWSLNMRGAM